MRRSCAICVCLLFGACATTPPPRSTRVYLKQNPVAALDGSWVQVEEAHWLECDIPADRTSTAVLEGKRQPGIGLIQAFVIASQDNAFERERDIDYAQEMKKCLAAKGYLLRPAMAPPMDSFSDTPEQLAAKRAARDKWMPEQYRLLLEEAAKRAKR
jgi:hypothetical protein